MAKEWTPQSSVYIGDKILWNGGGSGFGSNVYIKGGIYHGKVCWLGKIKEVSNNLIAGVEMEKSLKGGSDGVWETRHIFSCKPGHGLFLPLDSLSKLNSNKQDIGASKSSSIIDKNSKGKENSFSKKVLRAESNGLESHKSTSSKGGTNISNEINSNFINEFGKEKEVLRQDKDNSGPETKREASSHSVVKKHKTLDYSCTRDQFDGGSVTSKAGKGGFFNIFKWFSKKGSDKHVTGIKREVGSTTSLLSNTSSIKFFPIRQSVSADNPNEMRKSYNNNPRENYSEQEVQRRSSIVSTKSSTSLYSSVNRPKKRVAPLPPDFRLKESNSTSELNSRSSKSSNVIPKFEKAHSESPIYGRIKRKAPQPPVENSAFRKSGVSPPNCSSNKSFRPISTFSNFSSVSHSGSSTLQSSTCSENDSLTLRSDSSQKTTSFFPVCKDNKGPLSPKPWYKRKKGKANKAPKKGKENVYESWMPEIQYSRQRLSSSQTSTETRTETFFDKESSQGGQRFSILSSISDLDRAATEQLEREKAKKRAEKMNYDQKFYNVSSLHILSQKDLLPSEESSGFDQCKSNVGSSTQTSTYDNLNYTSSNSTTTIPHSSLSVLPSLNYSQNTDLNGIPSPSAPEFDLIDSLGACGTDGHSDSSGKINYEEYIEEIRKELEEEALRNPQQNMARATPMERAIFDPELFYQLAKDAKMNCESFSTPLKQSPERTTKLRQTTSNGEGAGTSAERSPISRLRSPHKNFGIRMNNCFTPDVSTILEGTESITSSNATTTPAAEDDRFNISALTIDQATDMRSLTSELNSEYRINTCDLQDIIESFALDLRQAEREETDDVVAGRKWNKEGKARDEALLSKEKENFMKWQKTMQETELTREDDEEAIQERKKKWVCDMCTLINQPWRLHCEACGSLRPPNPRRVENDELNPKHSPENNDSLRTASDDSPVTVIHEERNTHLNTETAISEQLRATSFSAVVSDSEKTPNLNWEKELQSYFNLFDNHAKAAKVSDSRRRNATTRNYSCSNEEEERDDDESNAYGRINVSKRRVDPRLNANEIDMQEIRRARIKKFGISESQNSSITEHMNCDRRERFRDGIAERISQLAERSPNLSKRSELNFEVGQTEAKSDLKKSPVMKPSGAVKNAVSIFNQLDQLKAAQEKPPPVKIKKRRSVTNILNFSDFERLVSGQSMNENPCPAPPRPNSPVVADIDIASAISKFDEMAALAEIDSIRKPVPKIQKKWIKPITSTVASIKNSFTNSSSSTEEYRDSADRGQPNGPLFEDGGKRNLIERASVDARQNGDSHDSIIKEAVLYTNNDSQRRSMSIGSATFELMDAKEFATIEAHHSRRPSPTEEIDGPTPLELSYPLLLPEISTDPYENLNSHEKNKMSLQTSVNDVDMLSRQLTQADGIASFKATLVKDEPKLGNANAKTLNRILKKLESAISSGKHEEASRLAHDLAKMRYDCLITHKGANSKELEAEGGRDVSSSRNVMATDCGKPNTRSCAQGSGVEGQRSNISAASPTNGEVVKRPVRVDPSRREVKSDTVTPSLYPNLAVSLEDQQFNVKMYVEDRASHQGPIDLAISSSMTVEDLKLKVYEEFGFPVEVQRWILGRVLADNDSSTLAMYKVTAEGCPIFLYLVAPDVDTKPATPKLSRSSSNRSNSQSRLDFENASPRVHNGIESPSQILNTPSRAHNGVENTSQDSFRVNKEAEISSRIKKEEPQPSRKVKQQPSTKSPELSSREQVRTKTAHITAVNPLRVDKKRLAENKPKIEVPSAAKIDGWVCPTCTLINPKERPGCEACATERPETKSNPSRKKGNLKQAMFALESQACVPNQDPFECVICFVQYEPGEGVVLRDCLHVFCRACLKSAIEYSETARVKCPFSNKNYSCNSSLQDREIRDVIGDKAYKKHLDKSVKEAAGSMRNVFYCKTPDCKGFCQFEDSVNIFVCDVCKKSNCLTCQAQHGDKTCKQYQEELANNQDENALKTKKFFDDIIRRGDGMPCPQCSIMLVRKWGCDWMRCPMCRTEICWVTRMPRWGPEGTGDTSGGCKCGVNGRKCHPKCTYCH